jgi:ABC-2 type transport system ATP-binding protein
MSFFKERATPVPTNDAIHFQDIQKTYRTRRGLVPALKGLSFAVNGGEIFGFAGPNGAGKSTAIKILVGLLNPDDGICKIFSEACGTIESKKMFGYLPEVTLYHEFMGALELLKIHAGLAGLRGKELEQKCEKALDRVGLSDRKKSRLSEFSKGMKQRFGIAQAIVGEPKLLILDELTSGLDPQAQASLLELLGDLRAQGLTIFFSSHHLAEIEKICDSVAILHKGELKAFGSLDQVLGVEQKLRVEIEAADADTQADSIWAKEGGRRMVAYLDEKSTASALQSLGPDLQRVVSVRPQRRSLESLFLELTADAEGSKQTL